MARNRHGLEGMRGSVHRYDVKQGMCRVSLALDGGHRRTHHLPPALLRVMAEPALSSGPHESHGTDVGEAEATHPAWELVLAAEHDDTSAAEALLQAGAGVQFVDGHQRSALWFAAANGCHELTALLLRAKAPINRHDGDGISPLGAACQGSHLQCAALLLQARANVDGVHGDARTSCPPLLLACDQCDPRCLELLLSHGMVTRPLGCARTRLLRLLRVRLAALGGSALPEGTVPLSA